MDPFLLYSKIDVQGHKNCIFYTYFSRSFVSDPHMYFWNDICEDFHFKKGLQIPHEEANLLLLLELNSIFSLSLVQPFICCFDFTYLLYISWVK